MNFNDVSVYSLDDFSGNCFKINEHLKNAKKVYFEDIPDKMLIKLLLCGFKKFRNIGRLHIYVGAMIKHEDYLDSVDKKTDYIVTLDKENRHILFINAKIIKEDEVEILRENGYTNPIFVIQDDTNKKINLTLKPYSINTNSLDDLKREELIFNLKKHVIKALNNVHLTESETKYIAYNFNIIDSKKPDNIPNLTEEFKNYFISLL